MGLTQQMGLMHRKKASWIVLRDVSNNARLVTAGNGEWEIRRVQWRLTHIIHIV